jgi:hypothetical protein
MCSFPSSIEGKNSQGFLERRDQVSCPIGQDGKEAQRKSKEIMNIQFE